MKRVGYVDGKKDREYEEVVQAEEEIFIPPDTTAQIFWLKNRKPEKWKDKQPEPDKSKDMTEILQNIRIIDDIIRNPAPDRHIEDFE